MSDKKQTAIEYLQHFLSKHCNPTVCDIEWSDFNIAINEAKNIEKRQIENSFNNGFINGFSDIGDGTLFTKGEQYYKETYES